MLTDIPGVRVGHVTDGAARTGCTAVLWPEGTVPSGEVRGGAPATRDFELLAPHRTCDRIDATVLCGGSLFGLAAADGVVRFLEEQGVGFPTAVGPVPIVVAMALFDLMQGDASVRPTAESGYRAASVAVDGPHDVGLVGAGTGASVGSWRGIECARRSGLGTATVRHGDLAVSTLIAVNAWGDIDDGTGEAIIDTVSSAAFGEGDAAAGKGGDTAGKGGDAVGGPGGVSVGDDAHGGPGGASMTNTTIGVIATNARLDKVGCLWVAQGGHDGYARALMPSHTRADGDALVVGATGAVDADPDTVRSMAVIAVTRAIRSLA